jgi:EAL domain-containing protein (putative c-di-GMP-specific phosphodiesterase class I)
MPEDLTERELDVALAEGQLELHYQPKFDNVRGRIGGVEALVRWRHPTCGLLFPDKFIPIAERTGRIGRLTQWVIAEAVAQCGRWRDGGLDLHAAVNISAADLEDLELPDRSHSLCRRAAIDASTITFELTESMAMRQPTDSLDVLTRLRLKGFHLSLDDFGTGYSSLIRLRRLPLSELKIDRSFVMHMLTDADCRSIVEVVVLLAQKLGLRSVAEGVETREALVVLTEMGCDMAQGYYLSRPVPAGEIPTLVGRLDRRAAGAEIIPLHRTAS